jgi:hypothetical protein
MRQPILVREDTRLFNTLHQDNLAVQQVLMKKLINGKNRFKRTGEKPFSQKSHLKKKKHDKNVSTIWRD